MTDTPHAPCENCGRTIGKLENTFPWAKTRVCWDCYKKLTEQQQAFETMRAYPPETPSYKMLKFVSDCLWYVGLFVLIIGVPVCLLGMLISSVLPHRSYVGFWLGLFISSVVWGFSAAATAQFLYAIRDMVRNSWIIARK